MNRKHKVMNMLRLDYIVTLAMLFKQNESTSINKLRLCNNPSQSLLTEWAFYALRCRCLPVLTMTCLSHAVSARGESKTTNPRCGYRYGQQRQLPEQQGVTAGETA